MLQDELLWAATWLHKASRRREYREYIVKNEVVLRAGDTINEFGWDNKHAGINVLISKVSPFYPLPIELHSSSSIACFLFLITKQNKMRYVHLYSYFVRLRDAVTQYLMETLLKYTFARLLQLLL